MSIIPRVIRRRGLVAGAVALVTLAAASGAVQAKPAAGLANGGTVTFAQEVGNIPNYILPITISDAYTSSNLALFQPLLWRPLFWLGSGSLPEVSTQLSLASLPTYSNGGRTATMTLKRYVWSDGTPVTSRDVQFFLNLIKAGKTNWGGYTPGGFPDIVVGFTARGPRTFSITFNRSYSQDWLLNDVLNAITPLPQQAWDRTSAGGPVGNLDLTPAGATRVYSFLAKQAQTLGTYATNPLWRVVDGPFHLFAYDAATNYVSFVPNPAYSGPAKPRIAKLVEMPFTSTAAEFNALRAGELDYGYLPNTDINQRAYFASRGYSVQAWPGFGINYVVLNWTNPKFKSYFRQLYIRQALQVLVDQPLLIRTTLHGYGYPIDGPIPLVPRGPFVSALELHNPYPYSPSRAVRLLTAHGWTVVRNGTDTCRRPGTGPTQCGAGIPKGGTLTFSMNYPSGDLAVAAQFEDWKSVASTVGITINLDSLPLAQIGAITNPCTKGPSCTWQMGNWLGWGYGSPYPTGEQTFSALQTGGYSTATNTANITATHLSSSPQAMFRYENYLALTLPVIWWPNAPGQISVISPKLHGVIQNALGSVTPETWSLTP